MAILPQFLFVYLFLYEQQLSRLIAEQFYTDLLVHVPDHVLFKIAELLDFGPLEAACASYYHQEGRGRPAEYSISLLVRAILVGWLYGLSLRQLEQRLYTDLAVRWFVGCRGSERIPDHTTLERFELWLMHRNSDLYFGTVLRQVDDYFPAEPLKIQIGDTYAMIAYAAEEGLVGRIRHVCRRFLMEMVEDPPADLESYLKGFDWLALFSPKPEASRDLLDEAARAQRLQTTVLAAVDFRRRATEMLKPHSGQKYRFLRAWLNYLSKVLSDEVKIETDEQGNPVGVSRLSTKEKGDFRLISATDPDATYRMHGEEAEDITLGYNVQVAATPNGFIRETKAYTGADPDQSGVAALIAAQVERTGDCPPKLIYDMAAGNGKTFAEVEQVSNGKTQLVAKLMPYQGRCKRFGPYDFSLSEDRQLLTCPAGKVSNVAYASQSGDGKTFRFLACQCWNGEPPKRMKNADLAMRCPLWEQCRDSRSGPGAMRQVFISDYRQQVLNAETYNQTAQFQKEMKQRPLIERVIFELTNYCGARRCRRRGLLAADFQAKMCAAVYNLKLLVRKLSRCTKKLSRTEAALAG